MDDDLKHFRVSAGLKNIIGNELITDDFVAVFELVKNSYDARARKVTVRFENLGKPDEASLTIADDGKGMTREDLYEKWLFVAYSAKKNDTEDDDLKKRDYRDLIGVDRPFAGAKGIGRFSCDRLGRYLTIHTRRDPASTTLETLMVDWRNFEENDKRRFEEIDIEYGETPESEMPELKRGTVLQITGLRSQWTDKRLRTLREELQRLISPEESQDGKKDTKEPAFRIVIDAPEFADQDRREKDPAKRINGDVQNFLFERLLIKTTQITCRFSASGQTIETELRDRGTLIYKIVERNGDFPNLRNLTFRIFYLNRSAKIAFKHTVGVEPVKYGSVFLYKNGVRVQPYGKAGDDGFGIDRRKQQGTRRYLGTRDIAGRIEIRTESSEEKRFFKETSSRNDGLIESPERDQLFLYFKEIILRRLESYVVDVMQWGNPPRGSENDEAMIPQPSGARNEILELVKRLTDSKEIVRFEADPELLSIVTERQADSARAILDNFERIAGEHPDTELANEARRLKREMDAVLKDRAEAAIEVRSERSLRILSERQLETERQRNKILHGLVTPPEEQRAVLQHWVGIVAAKIGGLALGLIGGLQKEDLDGQILADTIQNLAAIKFESDKLLTLSDLVAESGFKLQKQKITGDLNKYFLECLDHEAQTGKVETEIAWSADQSFPCAFKPVEIAMLVDNLVDNATKAGARTMRWSLQINSKSLHVCVANDGRPLVDHMRKLLFEVGATSTHGHGLGLFHCRQIVRGMQGEMIFLGNDPQMGGAAFEMRFGR
jgi:signal transduction histidine kinase